MPLWQGSRNQADRMEMNKPLGTYGNPIPVPRRCKAVPNGSEGPIKNGTQAIVTHQFHYRHDVYDSEIKGFRGERFMVGLYVPAESSDSGFAFYRGNFVDDRRGVEALIPADLCRPLESERIEAIVQIIDLTSTWGMDAARPALITLGVSEGEFERATEVA